MYAIKHFLLGLLIAGSVFTTHQLVATPIGMELLSTEPVQELGAPLEDQKTTIFSMVKSYLIVLALEVLSEMADGANMVFLTLIAWISLLLFEEA